MESTKIIKPKPKVSKGLAARLAVKLGITYIQTVLAT
jgi:hypothetical protein